MDDPGSVVPVDPVLNAWPRAWPKAADSPDGVVPVPVDPVPGTWPKEWRKAVEAFRASQPDAFAWSCDWHGSARTFHKACLRVCAVLELRHGQVRNVDWVLILVRGSL